MNTSASYPEIPAMGLSAPEAGRMAVSAWVDGEADGWSAVWSDDAADAHTDSQAAWHSYHLIGDVLRAGATGTEWTGSAQSLSTAGSVGFARTVTRMAQVQGVLIEMSSPAVPVVVAAQSVAAAALVPATREAANDGVFRWKMVSGAAVFVAVLAVSWGWPGVGQGDAADVTAIAPAVTPPPLAVLASESFSNGADASPVWVATPQGTVLRDARLQELMQAHRQLGGASALQAPAGFLRTATFDANQR